MQLNFFQHNFSGRGLNLPPCAALKRKMKESGAWGGREPDCEASGEYKPRQYDPRTKVYWCVDRTGKTIADSESKSPNLRCVLPDDNGMTFELITHNCFVNKRTGHEYVVCRGQRTMCWAPSICPISCWVIRQIS